MKCRIDYMLRGKQRFWICKAHQSFADDDALDALLALHRRQNTLKAMRAAPLSTTSERRTAIADLDISDVRFQIFEDG
ncbi:hypothetical protein [Pseudomonas urethralis]|uniref:hypothetical protein n=1 Tax=Pseudomonas urethralis TaxID=2740517 RepID=UPI001F15871A|nr:hypothetical protein [Pseudomonas urethralis]